MSEYELVGTGPADTEWRKKSPTVELEEQSRRVPRTHIGATWVAIANLYDPRESRIEVSDEIVVKAVWHEAPLAKIPLRTLVDLGGTDWEPATGRVRGALEFVEAKSPAGQTPPSRSVARIALGSGMAAAALGVSLPLLWSAFQSAPVRIDPFTAIAAFIGALVLVATVVVSIRDLR